MEVLAPVGGYPTPSFEHARVGAAERPAASRPPAPLDIRDHRSGVREPLTVDVEEAYLLLDDETLDRGPRIETMLQAAAHGDFVKTRR